MRLTVDALRAEGGFTGPPEKREIQWKGNTFDVYVRRLSYQTAVTDLYSLAGRGDLAAHRIAHCICDENGKPIFTVADITGVNPDGNPVMVDGIERGALDGELSMALLSVIGEVNELGKPHQKSRKKRKSGTNSSLTA